MDRELGIRVDQWRVEAQQHIILHQWRRYDPSGMGNLTATQVCEMYKTYLRRVEDDFFPRKISVSTAGCCFRKNGLRVAQVYDFGDQLGQGAFGKVMLVQHKVAESGRLRGLGG